MELKSIVSYKSAFNLSKILIISILICCFIFSGAVIIWSNSRIKELTNTIYFLDSKGQAFSTSGKEQTLETRVFEYEAHVKQFYSLFYAFDENSYQRNVDAALYLVGDCGSSLISDYNDNKVKEQLQQKNLIVQVNIKSVKIDVNSRPITGSILGIQTVRRLNGETNRNLCATFTLIDVERSRDNPHGVKIENWKINDNTKIEEN